MNYPNLLPQIPTIVLLIVYLWSLAWKGLAAWRAAKNSQRNWFIAILVLNTVGVLEIAYLFFFCKKRLTLKELKFWELKLN